MLSASCRDPTQITVRVTTNLACDPSAVEHLSRAWVESGGTAFGTANCKPQSTDNYVGTLVIVPGPAGNDAKVDVFVVGSVNGSANDETCLNTKKNLGGCLVVHRRLSFIPHTPLELPVSLDARCLDVQCDEATETCIEGVCKPIPVDPRPPVDAGYDAPVDAPVDGQVPPPSPITHLVAGGQSTCAVRQNGDVVCWGNNGNGRLLGPTDVTPPTVVPELQGVTNLTLGGSHACAIFPDATLRCWGDASQGQVGNGTTKALGISVVALSTSVGWQAVAAGGSHTCALAKNLNGESPIYCWGRDAEGQVSGLGVPANAPVLKPQLVTDLTATQVALGANFTCVVSAPSPICQSCSNLVCWGGNLRSQAFTPASPIAAVTRLTGAMAPSADAIYLGASHGLAVLGGSLIGWGDNTYGQLAYDPMKGTLFSAPIAFGTTTSAVGVALGARYSCALTGGSPQCFGDPALVGIDLTTLPPLAEIAGGSEHVCGLAKDGRVFCWGDNTFGQLGGGTGKELGPRVVAMP